ncbi:hypothetical protein QJS04_geneDACA002033 [Acorus gramineus]|uniref:UDP-N-acetylmuramoyl-L-alanyl-D-glutamate--2,6-diaminopimelate ligase MurE homolog, chloroplastic n=1 Tax=Acorus gramineus TaxID=55184 RepID=A0AAV9A8S5_ACOGR|nr:hypothetical protein QJS04_geneDACA002033 [Acorus gramineus]
MAFLSSLPTFPLSTPKPPLRLPLLHLHRLPLPPPRAIGPDGKFYPDPSDDDPPEAPEDSGHGVSKFQQIERRAARARKLQEDQYKKDQPTFLAALALEQDAPDDPVSSAAASRRSDDGDDLFGEIDIAISLKRKEFVQKGLLPPNPPPKQAEVEQEEELSPEEAVDLDEIQELGSVSVDGEADDPQSFDLDIDGLSQSKPRIVEPEFKMTLAELLDESRVVPLSVRGNLEVPITGIGHDSRRVQPGDLFVCCVGRRTDGHLYLNEADKRGAVAVVASKEVNIDDTLGCKALVIVEDTGSALPSLAAAFYRHPSRRMSVIGVTGTNGKTTTVHLVKAIYEAMAVRTGMLSNVANYVHGDNLMEEGLEWDSAEPRTTTPDAVTVQKMMAKMVHNGADAVVMEASSHGLALRRCDEVDFDVAVFTNLTRDHHDFYGTEEEYRESKGKLFDKMVDPERHRKVVNIDDPNAGFFVGRGNSEVPVVTFAMENKRADVHPLKFELSLFETQVLVNTPNGILEISSGLLGRHNIYNLLAAVAVGIAVGAPLEDIVMGIEEVDGVPGRCELIDEEQAFAVIVDYAHTPDALSRLLDAVRELNPQRVITVYGCCGESDRGKRPMMTKIATEKSDVVILTSDNPKTEDPLDILDDMLAGVGWTMQDYLKHGENDYYPPLPNGHRLFVHDIRRVAVRAAVAMGEEGDIVVVAGKGHETYQIEGNKKEFFDDREECREALQYVDELHQAGIDTSEFPWRLPESH